MTSTTPKVSILVAAYNIEKWIEECLQSISNQTYDNWECIIVNDGSTDSTPDIAAKYCNSDSRFKLITQTNQGLPAARRTGFDNSQGEFIYFVDGDDALRPDCLEYCVNNIGDSDILACGCVTIKEDGTVISQTSQEPEATLNRQDALRALLSRKLLTSVWSKFYRRELISGQSFNHLLHVGEDIYLNINILLKNPHLKVKVTTHPIYNYRIIVSSMSHIRSKKHVTHLHILIKEINTLYNQNKEVIDSECLDEYACNMMRDLLYDYHLQGFIKHTDPAILDYIRQWRPRISNHSSAEYKLSSFADNYSKLSDLRLTFRYLPEHLKMFAKIILKR